MSNQPLVRLITDKEVEGKAKDLFEQIKKNTGKVPKWMRVMANCENIMLGFFDLFQATMGEGKVERLLKWKVAYQISELNKCEFCVSVAKIQLKSFGLSDKEIEKICKIDNKKEVVAMKYTVASTCHAYNIEKKIFDSMKESFTDEQIVEITSVIGLFNFINRFNDSLGVLPDI
ncbi:MAG TPA: hypothetical protein ENI70_01430 [Candidatus Peregrinibacteria bacterium]|nr:hypothetical protein [Candidatus Peregrinibacteria bacterium]